MTPSMASNSSIKTIRDGQCNHFLNAALSVQPLMNQNSSSKHTLHATFFVANKGDIPSFREYLIVTPNLVIVTPFLDSSREPQALYCGITSMGP